MKRNLFERSVSTKSREKHEKWLSREKSIKNERTHLAESISPQRVTIINKNRFCDMCDTWIFQSITTHDNTKSRWKKVVENTRSIHFCNHPNQNSKQYKNHLNLSFQLQKSESLKTTETQVLAQILLMTYLKMFPKPLLERKIKKISATMFLFVPYLKKIKKNINCLCISKSLDQDWKRKFNSQHRVQNTIKNWKEWI